MNSGPSAWWDSVVTSTRRLLATGAVDRASIRGPGDFRTQPGMRAAGRDGRLLRESTPIWSDTRPRPKSRDSSSRSIPAAGIAATGNGFPAPHYTVFKILWYRDNEPEMFRRIHKVIGTKDYINFR